MSSPLSGRYAARTDPIATPAAVAVLEALLAGFDDPSWGVDAPCVAGLVSGSVLIADYCCADSTADGSPCMGQLTVRVVDCYPTERFPAPRETAVPVCGTAWAVTLEVAVLRCAPQVDTDASPPVLPTMEQERDAAEMVLADAGVIRHVLTDYAVGADRAYTLGRFEPLGPQGGCVGGSVHVTLLIE